MLLAVTHLSVMGELVPAMTIEMQQCNERVYTTAVPFAASTWPARYSEPVMRMRGGTS